MAHLNVLLLHLVRELEGTLVPHVAHGRLQWVESTARTKLLRGGDHAHVNILLVCSLQLLLLLL